MKKLLLISTALLLLSGAYLNGQENGTLKHYENFESEFVDSRNIDVWLPEGYKTSNVETFPVIYMHDGQNLFNSETAYNGEEWGVDETITKLASDKKIPEAIVVGIWNTPKRYREYMPEKPLNKMSRKSKSGWAKKHGGIPVSDDYLKFIVEELKPFIDSVYRTSSGRQETYIMGSSMGGLISIYALSEYPQIFRGAACLSTHSIGDVDIEYHEFSDAFAAYLDETLPDGGGHLAYFDYGTVGLDSLYQNHQLKIDKVFMNKGYRVGMDWITKKYGGHDHNEIYWRERLAVPLMFLLEE